MKLYIIANMIVANNGISCIFGFTSDIIEHFGNKKLFQITLK